jgi:hypothetical protein
MNHNDVLTETHHDVLTEAERETKPAVSSPSSLPLLPLSEAIRLGAMLGKQCFGRLHWSKKGGVHRRSCAIGSALDATGIKTPDALDLAYPRLLTIYRPCPIGCPRTTRFSADTCGVIAHLNDDHRWTREQIADWVESLEREEKSLRKETAGFVSQSHGNQELESV